MSTTDEEALKIATSQELAVAFVAVMNAIRDLPTEQSQFMVLNWAYQALDQREQPLSGTDQDESRKLREIGMFAIRYKGFLLTQRFYSRAHAERWAKDNYKGRSDFEIEEIVAPNQR